MFVYPSSHFVFYETFCSSNFFFSNVTQMLFSGSPGGWIKKNYFKKTRREDFLYYLSFSFSLSSKLFLKNSKISFSWCKLCQRPPRIFVYEIICIICNSGQSVPIPRHSQTRAKNADLVTQKLRIIILRNIVMHINVKQIILDGQQKFVV